MGSLALGLVGSRREQMAAGLARRPCLCPHSRCPTKEGGLTGVGATSTAEPASASPPAPNPDAQGLTSRDCEHQNMAGKPEVGSPVQQRHSTWPKVTAEVTGLLQLPSALSGVLCPPAPPPLSQQVGGSSTPSPRSAAMANQARKPRLIPLQQLPFPLCARCDPGD